MEQKSVMLSKGIKYFSAGDEEIKQQDEISTIGYLYSCGWSIRRISRELDMSRGTVRKYIRNGGVVEYQIPARQRVLDVHGEWLREKFFRHGGNADVIRQELESEKGLSVSLRTVERAVKLYRDELRRESVATVRFETPPGKQMQADFGEKYVEIGGERVKVHFFFAVLGSSRRLFIKPFLHENQNAWFMGIEEAFRYFGGIPLEVLADNPKSLVVTHKPATRELVLNEKFKSFAAYWGFTPRICVPGSPRTKGKVESAVNYGKKNCLAGRVFVSWEEMEQHIIKWLKEVSDMRSLTDAHDTPLSRYETAERAELKPTLDRAPYVQIREYVRKVSRDSFVNVDTNRYSVPWKYIGESVLVYVTDTEVTVSLCTGHEIASHALHTGRHQRLVGSGHLAGIVYRAGGNKREDETPRVPSGDDLTRPLAVYEEAVSAA